jgi:hypothetical protein
MIAGLMNRTIWLPVDYAAAILPGMLYLYNTVISKSTFSVTAASPDCSITVMIAKTYRVCNKPS